MAVTSPGSVQTTLHVPNQDRIPSLSKSEVSGTDTSGAASTPGGPTRVVTILTSTEEGSDDGQGGDRQWLDESRPDGEVTYDYRQEDEVNQYGEDDLLTPAPNRYGSPAQNESFSPTKLASSSHLSPGIPLARQTPSARFWSPAQNSPKPSPILQDVTTIRQDSRGTTPFTPSPLSSSSKTGDFSTPRAPLDDAERRKSHVLAVLSSTGLPSRTTRPAPRGTPHPLRRVSTAPASESIAEESSPASRITTPGSRAQLGIDANQTQSANESFVSVASSSDLTSDRRATTVHPRLSRGNTSFPTILLPTSAAISSPGGSLKGLLDHRADGVKIHKHLNAMNQQLLDANAELAREAEAWRDEVDRLMGLLQKNGVEVEAVDVVALAQAGNTSTELTGQRQKRSLGGISGTSQADGSAYLIDKSDLLVSQLSVLGVRGGMQVSPSDLLEGLSPEEHAAVMQEMAERLEALEEGLTEKDRIISELQEDLEAAKSSGGSKVQEVMNQLNQQLEEVEKARVALHSDFAVKTEQHAKRFGEICSGFEEQVKSLESQLASAKGETDRLRREKARLEDLASTVGLDEREKEMRKQVSRLELLLHRAREEAMARIGEVETLKKQSTQAEEDCQELTRKAGTAQARLADLEAQLQSAAVTEAEMKALRVQLDEARAACEAVEDELAQAENDMTGLRQVKHDQEGELDRLYKEIKTSSQKIHELERDLESAASESQRQQQELEMEIDCLKEALREAEHSLAQKEAELNAALGKNSSQNLREKGIASSSTPTRDGDADSTDEQASVVRAMEEQLDNAFREIGRLKHEISATPHRKSSIEVRDARIKALEREKAALTERLASVSASPVPPGMQTAGSPFNRPTPFVHKAIASLRTPKTPGPLKDVSINISPV